MAKDTRPQVDTPRDEYDIDEGLWSRSISKWSETARVVNESFQKLYGDIVEEDDTTGDSEQGDEDGEGTAEPQDAP